MGEMRNGQVLIVVLLILGVMVTVGLAVASRSVTEVRVSATQDESIKALEAAETGIEKALGGVIAAGSANVSGSVPTVNANYNVSNVAIGSGDLYEPPFALESGDILSVDMTGYTGNQVRICWGKPASTAAIEAILYYRSGGSTRVARTGFDRNAGARNNNFTATGVGGGCSGAVGSYASSTVANLVNDLGMESGGIPLLLRLRMLYNSTEDLVAVVAVGSGNFPGQAKEITSVGQAGDTTQKIKVISTNPDLPAIFENAVFSGGALIQ